MKILDRYKKQLAKVKLNSYKFLYFSYVLLAWAFLFSAIVIFMRRIPDRPDRLIEFQFDIEKLTKIPSTLTESCINRSFINSCKLPRPEKCFPQEYSSSIYKKCEDQYNLFHLFDKSDLMCFAAIVIFTPLIPCFFMSTKTIDASINNKITRLQQDVTTLNAEEKGVEFLRAMYRALVHTVSEAKQEHHVALTNELILEYILVAYGYRKNFKEHKAGQEVANVKDYALVENEGVTSIVRLPALKYVANINMLNKY